MNFCLRPWSLLDCPVNDLLVKRLPFFNQLWLDMTDVMNACVTHLLLQYAIAGRHRGTKGQIPLRCPAR